MSDMRIRKVDVRLHPQLRSEIEQFAEARFEGNLSLAMRMLLRVGLDTCRELYSVDKPQNREASTDNGEPEDEQTDRRARVDI